LNRDAHPGLQRPNVPDSETQQSPLLLIGKTMPDVDGDCGTIFWQWSLDLSAPKL